MPVEFTLAENSLYDPDVKQLIFTNVNMPPPGNTLLLILMANGSYAGGDFGPLAGQYDGTWPFFARAAAPVTLTMTEIPLGGILETWPAPSPPYEVTIEAEIAVVTALNRATATITVTRSSPVTHSPGVLIRGETVVTDDGSTPPLLNIPGEPTAAPARSSSWWAHVVSGANDPAFGLWESRYWQSAPTLPVGHPVWATLSILAHKIDGTEASTGMYDPLTNELRVAVLGTVPSPFLIQPRGTLLAFSDTIEILPLPVVFGDLTTPADRLPTVPPDPRWPPFALSYPVGTWLPQLVGTLPNDNEDLWLPIQLTSKRSQDPDNVIFGWDDITGTGVEDNPLFFQDENWFSLGNYATRRQIGHATFTATHDPNPITYALVRTGFEPPVANLPPGPVGGAREPGIGQLPWWELAGLKFGDLVIGGTTVDPPNIDSSLYSDRLHTGDIMLILAQSNGLGAPADPDGWTPIPEVSGPNPYGHQPVTLETLLPDSVAAGATSMVVSMAELLDFGPAPFTAVIDAGFVYPVPPAPPGPPVMVPAETVTVSSYAIDTPSAGYATLSIGSLGLPHQGGTRVMLTNPDLLAYDQYVAAWWKVAEGPPPDEENTPSEADQSLPSISFPDGTQCSARAYGIMAEPSDPFSMPKFARVDIPAPAWAFSGTDVITEDAITLRANIALTVGARQHPLAPLDDDLEQEVLHGDRGTFMIQPVANPYVPNFSWQKVDPAGVGTALVFAFRGLRERPWPYELVDGHYAPTYLNRGALPPCAGGVFFTSSDMTHGENVEEFHIPRPPAEGAQVLLKALSGNARYLHAWLWAQDIPAASVTEFRATIFSTVTLESFIWWEETAPLGADIYLDPPADRIFRVEEDWFVKVTTVDPCRGLFGLAVWSEEDCQPPTVSSYGLTAAFRYRHKDLHSPSNQQPSIVG